MIIKLYKHALVDFCSSQTLTFYLFFMLFVTIFCTQYSKISFIQANQVYYNLKFHQKISIVASSKLSMKYTHHALTSIHVEKVQNITTSMTRAGLGDDTYRRQRQKQRYLKCKQQQIEKQEKMRQDFMQQRQQKIKQTQSITEKKSLKRQKKKQLQKQRQKKMKLLKKIGDLSGSSSDQSESNHNQDHLKSNNEFSNPQQVGNKQNDTEKALNQMQNQIKDQNQCE